MKRNTAILVAVALVCSFGIAILELGPQRVQQQRRVQSEQLLQILPEEVKSLTIQKADETIVLDRIGDSRWQLLRPLETQAETGTVQLLIEGLVSAEAPPIGGGEDSATVDLDAFGLALPQQTLIVEREEGESRILFGDNTFDNSGMYVQVDSGPIRILELSLTPQLTPSLYALRDKSLTDWAVADLQTFEVVTQDETIALVRQDDSWRLENRPNVPLDASAFADTLSQASFLQASQFVAETQSELATYGLDSPTLVLKAGLADGSTQTLAIGSQMQTDPSSVYAISSERDGVVGIATTNLDTIAKTEFELRDGSLGPISSFPTGKIAIVSSDPALSRSLSPATSSDAGSEQWTISDDPDRLISIDAFLTPLSDARAKQFLPADDATATVLLENPSFSIELSPLEGVANDPLMLEFAPSETELYVRTSYNPDILLLDRQFYDLLETAISTFKPAT